MRHRHFTSGSIIFDEGDVSSEAYLVRSGRVEVVKRSSAGPVRLAVLGAGDILGEMGLLDERPRSASARALEDVDVEALNSGEFTAALLGDPTKAVGILRAIFERLRAVNDRLIDAAPRPAAEEALPRVRLLPLTPDVEAVVGAEGMEIGRFPFRVGRRTSHERENFLQFNEVELPDAEPHVLASNHFSIDLAPSGLVLRDRGSRWGTVVNGVRIGASESSDVAPLRAGENEVIAGPNRALAATRASPFRFAFIVG